MAAVKQWWDLGGEIQELQQSGVSLWGSSVGWEGMGPLLSLPFTHPPRISASPSLLPLIFKITLCPPCSGEGNVVAE